MRYLKFQESYFPPQNVVTQGGKALHNTMVILSKGSITKIHYRTFVCDKTFETPPPCKLWSRIRFLHQNQCFTPVLATVKDQNALVGHSKIWVCFEGFSLDPPILCLIKNQSSALFLECFPKEIMKLLSLYHK